MNGGFPNQGFSNQSGSHFGVVAKLYGTYDDNGENNDGLTRFNHQLTPVIKEGEVKVYQQMENPSDMSNHFCDNCSGYYEQIDNLCQENDLLHQLVDNLRKRARDSQSYTSLQLGRKYESSSGISKESNSLFGNNEVAKLSAGQTSKPYGTTKDEDKVTINRMKAEMDFYKALNTNTESCWRKKLADLQTEKDTVIKELQKFIADNTETIDRITKELEIAKHAKQDTINKWTSDIFSVKSSNQKTIASLTTELEKIKIEKKDAQDRMFKMVHELALSENRAQENAMEAKQLAKELNKVKKESQETIDELLQKLDNIGGKESTTQAHFERLTKDLAATKAQYHQQINKLSKDIEAIQNSKGGKDYGKEGCWRK